MKKKHNFGLYLFFLNIALVVIAILVKDPFQLFKKSYHTAPAFFTVKADSITKITIEKSKLGDSKYELVRDGTTFKLKTSKGALYPVETEKINQFVKSLLYTKKYTIVTSNKDKWLEYGFNEEELKIEVFNGNNSEGILYVGSVTPIANFTHVRFKDSSDVYLIEDNLKNVCGRGQKDHFLNKKFNPNKITADNISYLELRINQNPDPKSTITDYILQKEQNNWKVISPQESALSTEEVKSHLSRIASYNADEIVLDENLPNLEPFQFDLIYKFQDEKNPEKITTLHVIGFEKTNKVFYMKVNDEKIVYKMNDYQFRGFLDYKPIKLIEKNPKP